MIKKIVFTGCSTTAGNELWEEANVPNYTSMTFKEARIVMNAITIAESELRAYNYERAYPAIIGKKLGIETVNLSWPGQSNKEVIGRLVNYFKDDQYTDTAACIQFTTHNRMLVRFKEQDSYDVAGSVVIGMGDDSRLTRTQNNILKEVFFELLPETMLSLDDFVYVNWAVEKLKSKGVSCFVLSADTTVTDWVNWDQINSATQKTNTPVKNDRDPQYLESMGVNLFKDYLKHQLMPNDTFMTIVGRNAVLPRFHFKQSAHYTIADRIIEGLKNVKLV